MPADPFTSADLERVSVWDRCRMRPERVRLGGRSVWAIGGVMSLVLAQDLS
jgi:hypothetical protein